jgi:hypothetical protein
MGGDLQGGLGEFILPQQISFALHLLMQAAHADALQSPRQEIVPLHRHGTPAGWFVVQAISTGAESLAPVAVESFVSSPLVSARDRASVPASVSKVNVGTASQPRAHDATHAATHVLRGVLTARRRRQPRLRHATPKAECASARRRVRPARRRCAKEGNTRRQPQKSSRRSRWRRQPVPRPAPCFARR